MAFTDSRRLTGPNVYFIRTAAALEALSQRALAADLPGVAGAASSAQRALARAKVVQQNLIEANTSRPPMRLEPLPHPEAAPLTRDMQGARLGSKRRL